jgi:hypothetical protein
VRKRAKPFASLVTLGNPGVRRDLAQALAYQAAKKAEEERKYRARRAVSV